jgi:3',5'-cyclic AMP phosphodiesterase CpdA
VSTDLHLYARAGHWGVPNVRFRVLHVTDLHIAVPPEDNHFGQRTLWRSREHLYPSCANPYALEAAARFLWNRRNELDLVLLTGDVADDGLERNLHAAFRFVASPATDGWFMRPFSPTLDAARLDGPPFFVLPGNHDRFEGVRRLPGGVLFDQTFGNYWRAGLGGTQSVVLEKDGSKLAFVGADFCLHKVRNATIYVGQGRAYKHVVEALVQNTADLRARYHNLGVVWVTHFPPLLDVNNTLKLLRPERLLSAARSNGVQHVIAGHLHRNQINSYAGVEIICTGSATSTGAGELYGNWIYQFNIDVAEQGDLVIEKLPFQYEPAEAAFW